MPSVYPASKAKQHAFWWRALRSSGLRLVTSWIDWTLNRLGAETPTADRWSRHWVKCMDEAAAADVCLFVPQ